jgi:hypothetical protein
MDPSQPRSNASRAASIVTPMWKCTTLARRSQQGRAGFAVPAVEPQRPLDRLIAFGIASSRATPPTAVTLGL